MHLVRTLIAWGVAVAGAIASTAVPACAFETPTHRLINERAAVSSAPLADYLTGQLHFVRGAREPIDGRTVTNWIGDGGVAEDQLLGIELLGGLTRAARHFHTPLLSWDASGLDVPPVPRFQSSVRWAQSDQGAILGRAAWRDARASFFDAATAATEADRRRHYARTFRILGQLMHLVADLAQPAHTRNDSHILWDPFEAFMKDARNALLVQGFQTFDWSILSRPTGDPVATVPVAHIWDANLYDGTAAPDDAVSPFFGLAEISSANFFSGDTIRMAAFQDPVLPLPAVELLAPKIAPYITGARRQYYGRASNGLRVDYLVAEGVFFRFLPPFVANFGLDDVVLTEYASHLMPRAIGYAAGLLEYFFRGRIEIAPPDRFAYGLAAIEPGHSGVFRTLRLKVRNATPGEDTGPGELVAVLQYRTPVTQERLIDNPIAPLADQLSIAVSRPIALALTPSFQELVVEFPTPIPTNAADFFLTVVYRGRLGLEANAVIVGGKDLFEPAPHDVVNGTDWECVDRHLYHVGDLAAFPPYGPDRPQRDVDADGHPDLFGPDVARGEFLKTFPLESPVLPDETTFDLGTAVKAAPQYSRVMVLQDRESYGGAVLVREIESVPTGAIGRDRLEVHSIPAMRNDFVWRQDTGQLVRRVTASISYRGVPSHVVLVMLTGDTIDCFADTIALEPPPTLIPGVVPE